MAVSAASLSAQPHLTQVDTYQGIPFIRAGQLDLSADGAFLYTADSSGLSVFGRAADASFQLLTNYLRPGDDDILQGAGEFVFSPDDEHLYIAGGSADAIGAFVRDPSTGLLTRFQTVIGGQGGMPVFENPAVLNKGDVA